jgi:hypothetical protein
VPEFTTFLWQEKKYLNISINYPKSMATVQAHIYVHHPEGEPTKLAHYSGGRAVIRPGPTNDIATSVEVLGKVVKNWYRVHREGRHPISVMERVTSANDRKELTDMLEVGRVKSVDFVEGGTEEFDPDLPMLHTR